MTLKSDIKKSNTLQRKHNVCDKWLTGDSITSPQPIWNSNAIDSYHFIFYPLFTMKLNQQEQLLAQDNIDQAELYDAVNILSIQEQAKNNLITTIEYNQVASTVEAPICDETNLLFKVEWIDEDALYAVLQAHKVANNTVTPMNEEYMEAYDKTPFQKIVTQTGNIEETRAHTDTGNYILWAIDLAGSEDDNLQDINWPEHKTNKLYTKMKKVNDNILVTLSNLWKEYNRIVKEKSVATGTHYLFLERQLKQTFASIKRIESIDKEYKEKMRLANWKRDVMPRLDNLLVRYTNWQQQTLKKGDDPMITWEEACLKSGFKQTDIDLYEQVLHNKAA